MDKGCGLIKDLKTRYSSTVHAKWSSSCGLIKDLKTRYYEHKTYFI